MMCLKLLPILMLIVILCSPSCATYPIYGTKRYARGQTNNQRSGSLNIPVQYQQYVRAHRLPVNYYDLYTYNQNYPDEYYYPQESYPLYYAAPRTSKYEVYQAVLPYYYNERPLRPMNYGYYGYDLNDPLLDGEDDTLQDERQKEPTGHEQYYDEQQKDDTYDDVNAAFLQNLIMSQIYRDNLEKQNKYSDDVYGKWENYPEDLKQDYFQEDKDVRELKQLVKPQKQTQKKPTKEDRLNWFAKNNKVNPTKEPVRENIWNWEDKRSDFDGKLNPAIYAQAFMAFTSRKNSVASTVEPLTVAPVVSSTEEAKKEFAGQKEEVLMRPATPIRHPFAQRVLGMVSKQDDRKRTPSVYDTIKHMLDMEKSMEKSYEQPEIKPAMRKRIISSEDSLTHQLSKLKKEH